MSIVVLQSAPDERYSCIDTCLKSVENWAARFGFEYRFIGDELFDFLTPDLRYKTRNRLVVGTDLARLLWLEQVLREPGVDAALWLDADMLIFDPEGFVLPHASLSYAVGQEIWIQKDKKGAVKSFPKVHNAYLYFKKSNPFLAFYIESAIRILRRYDGDMVPQLIGPKLLTALHNIMSLPIQETAGMASPLLLADILSGHGEALTLFKERSPVLPKALNLSASLAGEETDGVLLSEDDYDEICRTLSEEGL